MANGIRIDRGGDDAADFKFSEGLRSDILTLNVTIENLNAADSTIHETDIAKKIAILTRNQILAIASVAMEEQTDLQL